MSSRFSRRGESRPVPDPSLAETVWARGSLGISHPRHGRRQGGDLVSWLVILLIVLLVLALFGGVGYYRR